MSKDTKNEDIESGDLGLGLGLKPGSLPLLDVSQIEQTISSDGASDFIVVDDFYPSVSEKPLIPPKQNRYLKFSKLTRSSVVKREKSENEKQGEVPDPTCPQSIEKHNQENQIQRLRCYSVDSSYKDIIKTKQSIIKAKEMSREDIEKKLVEAEQEVEELQVDLEVYQKRLDAKYRAIAILKKQVSDTALEHGENEKRKRQYEASLEREVNTLNFELDQKEASFESFQEMWAVRFDSICKENAALSTSVEEKSNELREIQAQKTALARERDELLALLDVQERNKYLKSRIVSSEDAYSEFSSTELAVLGACKCRVTSPEPCGCALAGANMKREIFKLKLECESHKKRREEAYLTIDAYRTAFEEQLHRNRKLMVEMAKIAVAGPSKIEKAKVIIKNLIHLLNDDDYLITNSKQEVYTVNGLKSRPPPVVADEDSVNPMTDKELVLALTEILHQRNEAFAHQKLAAHVLSDRVKNLESQLAKYEDETST